MALDYDIPVRAVNPSTEEGGRPFSQKYNKKRFEIAPGQEKIIPVEAMVIWFGHPEAVDIPGDKRQRYRTKEFQRLCTKYGVYEKHEKVAEQFPTVRCYDLTTGEEHITVARDPEGKHLTPDVQSIKERQDLETMVAALSRQLAGLQAQINEQNKSAADNAHPENFGPESIPSPVANPVANPSAPPTPPADPEPPAAENSSPGPSVDLPSRPRPVPIAR